jgi:hypothetical protein
MKHLLPKNQMLTFEYNSYVLYNMDSYIWYWPGTNLLWIVTQHCDFKFM